MSRLIVVSNRVSVSKLGQMAAQGGLAVAILAGLKERGGIWFGWSGEKVETPSPEPHVVEQGNLSFATVDLSPTDYDEYYAGFANRVLWPLFHYRLENANFQHRARLGYGRVNAFFADALLPMLQEDDLIWVHDYHLIPLGQELRRRGVKNKIGFFQHIPWPPSELYVTLPDHREVLQELSHYDLVGFQTEWDVLAFEQYLRRETDAQLSEDGAVYLDGLYFRVGAFPISIDTDNVIAMAQRAGTAAPARRLADSLIGRRLVLGVDRLDYTKGLVERFEAFGLMLKEHPDLRGKVTFVQIAPPSRGDVPEYMEIRKALEAKAGEINGRYADLDYVPIRYLNKGFARETIAGFLRLADVGFITPLRDGMNLVAKEFVAAQDPKDPGVLVLSRFAGAAQEMTGGLLVNPHDIEGMAQSLARALDISREERVFRWHPMFQHLISYQVSDWFANFLNTLAAQRQ